jgi:hypothetical protein
LKLRESDSYGFKARFNATIAEKQFRTPVWVSPFHFGINQGPAFLMVENYRTGLVWNLMRKNPHIVTGLRRAGFSGGWLDAAGAAQAN